jgi:4-hydroxy-2-oxoglutarate aldolase
MSSIRPLVQGIYVPVLSFFNEDEDQTLDLETHKKHILWMAQSGVHGFLLQGSTAEAVALTPVERKLVRVLLTATSSSRLICCEQIIRATRDILDQHHFTHIPLIAGASGQTTRESVAYARDAQEAGADYIICLPPSYFAGSMTKAALESYYLEVRVFSSGYQIHH